MTASEAQATTAAEVSDGHAPKQGVEEGAACRGRPRDERATAAIVAAALRQLEDLGYRRMSMESVAAEAGVARATVYRRFEDKADLVTAAMAARPEPATGSEGPLEELACFLARFDARIAEHCLEVIGCLLAAREEPQSMSLHRDRVVQPRMRAMRSLLEEARDQGFLRDDADLDLVLQMLAGAVFARRIAGVPHERGWAHRAVAEACRGVATSAGLAQLKPAPPGGPANRRRASAGN
jgi:AcrR family transcriptional regulator